MHGRRTSQVICRQIKMGFVITILIWIYKYISIRLRIKTKQGLSIIKGLNSGFGEGVTNKQD